MIAFKIAFLEFGIFDLLDITLVALLLYQIYRLLSGSLAVNIFIGVLSILIFWFIVRALEMKLMEAILGQFIGLGIIGLLIVFQPEIRKFLLYIGRSSQFKRHNFFANLLTRETTIHNKEIAEIRTALKSMSLQRLGAIIVFARTSELQFFANTGTRIEGIISAKLIESIFDKNSPLHDGAMIIVDEKIKAAGCTLPVTENPDLPRRVGLRHKASVGITDNSDACAIIVSEETGEISFADEGQLQLNVSDEDLDQKLHELFLYDD
ncbi:MAG: TIGR00159 family protein [Chitinophagales bacterium]|nr:TIGR00159 family protein [Chitinophagales bacterium]